MKKTTKILILMLSLLFGLSAMQSVSVFAEDSTNIINNTVNNEITQIDNKISDLCEQASVSVSDYNELKEAVDSQIQNICITDDIELEDTLQIDYNICFCSENEQKTIYAPEGLRHIEVTDTDVFIYFNGIVLDGGCTKSKDVGGGIDVSYKNITIAGAVIENCSSDYGSGILNYLEEDLGSFVMYNCVVQNNPGDTAVFTCSVETLIYNCVIDNNTLGGLSLGPADEDQNSSIIIYDSTIKNNSYYDGAGMMIYWSDVYINDNTVIENNTAEKGGGIYLWECSLENHGVIKNNSAEKGGGIYAYNSRIVNYSEVSNNTVSYSGGGISLDESTFVMEDGEISYNTAGLSKTNVEHNGGGICIYLTSDEDDVVINNGVIKNNVAAAGSGISYDYSSNYSHNTGVPKIIINNGTISNNGYTVSDDGTIANITNEGGAVFGCYVEMNGGTIENNIARYGAGIKTLDFVMNGGSIQNNGYYEDENGTKTLLNYWGGGVYTYGNTTISDGTIRSNEAERGAGLYIVKNLTLNSPATVQNNTAADVGGGIYYYHLVDSSNTDMSRVTDNSAANDGDQYYMF